MDDGGSLASLEIDAEKKVPFIIIASGWSFRPEVIIMISDIK